MKMKVFLFCILTAVLIFSGLMGLAQEKQQKKDNNKKISNQEISLEEKKDQEKVDTDLVLESTGNTDDNSEMVDTGEFVYTHKGRRDPFRDLLVGESTKLKKEAKEGVEGLEIEQLELEGIINNKGKYIALFKGPDGKPYDVQVGQSVYDGEIIEINAYSVVFKKILTIALGGTKEKTEIKWLHPEKEKE